MYRNRRKRVITEEDIRESIELERLVAEHAERMKRVKSSDSLAATKGNVDEPQELSTATVKQEEEKAPVKEEARIVHVPATSTENGNRTTKGTEKADETSAISACSPPKIRRIKTEASLLKLIKSFAGKK